ncbi:MAG: endonuclease III [Lentisphaeria bacterium]|nr:endonuclease III [Lentisphaeria bacterium]
MRERLVEIFRLLHEEYGPQKCFLNHDTPFQLLVATILSAQCTDKTVNIVTEELFRHFSTPEEFAAGELSVLETLVHKCGYYRAKARHIKEAAIKICSDFDGKLPSTMEELVTLPGVGRKTANVVLADAFGLPGLPVDTHVIRLSNLIGLVKTKDPVKIEEILCNAFPEERKGELGELSHLLIIHGRSCCAAGRPACEKCIIQKLCNTHLNREQEKKHVTHTEIP